MRILHVINDLRLAGAERLVTDLSLYQQSNELSVKICALARANTVLETTLQSANVAVLFPDTNIRIRSVAHVSRLKDLFTDFDIVHAHLFPTQLWCVLARAMLGVRGPALVTTEHNTHNTRRNIPLLHPLDRMMYRQFDSIAAISESTKSALNQYLPETSSRTVVVPNGIILERFQQTRSDAERSSLFPQIPKNSPLMVTIGRLERQKDYPTLLRAFAGLPDCHLAIVGEGPLHAEIRSLIDSLSIEGRVHLLGTRDDVPAILRCADIYVQSSAWEGFGIAAVEAMASGLPVVVSGVPGLREVVGNSGLQFPAANPEALQAALQTLVNHPEKRAEFGQMARVRAQQFSVAACGEAYTSLYEDAMRNRL